MAITGRYFLDNPQLRYVPNAYCKVSFVESTIDTDGTTLLGLFQLEVFPSAAIRQANRTALFTELFQCPITSVENALADGYEYLKSTMPYCTYEDC